MEAEFVSDESITYQYLADKYGVSVSAVGKWALKRDWRKKREKFGERRRKKAVQKIVDRQADQIAKFAKITTALYDKILAAIEVTDASNTYAIRQLTASAKDLREMLEIKSDADKREQEARIAKLRKDVEEESTAPQEFRVRFETTTGEDTSEWAE
jgi:uncharacterized protein YjcR